jgi:hypothetical protein
MNFPSPETCRVVIFYNNIGVVQHTEYNLGWGAN